MSIYLDNAAGASGNPSSYNDEGRKARKALEEARLKIARFLGAHSQEIIFTSSGTESNNLALNGVAMMTKDRNEIITTPIEHPSVLEPIKKLTKWGFKIIYLKVDKNGLVDPEDLKSKITSKTALVSVMYANNEIGTIQPIIKLSKVIKQLKGVLFHVDACQATNYLDMNVNRLGVDLLTFNGTKIYGPFGIGVLYVRRGVKIIPQTLGGDQEFGLRAGTENLPGILGLAKAIKLIKKSEGIKTVKLRDYFIDQLKIKFPEAKINGAEGKLRLPNNISISFPHMSSENILLELDKYKIYAGSGSACTARSVEPSHVLKAIGVENKYIDGTIRFSLGRQTTKKDIDYVLKVLTKVISDLKKRYKK